ncbi:DMT family transporter [Paraburkholderia tropica]|uniref:DMT family transporter n=1 Tax=Paraburkholderia tropica TaxID=92647 RepID=UPI002ABD1DA0|nr:DMT family transporter [Paraburkholderia tropica]
MSAARHPSMHLADWLLLAVAFVWGTSYGVVKDALVFYPVLGLLALRFGLTFVLLSPALRTLRTASRRALGGVLCAGMLLLGIFLCETFGVMLTRASNAAFLISLCVVLTPLAEWAMLRRRPSRAEWAAVAVSLAGAWLLAGGDYRPNAGDALILLAALLRAISVCVTRRVMRDAAIAPLAVTAVQAGCVAGGSAVLALVSAHGQWQPLPTFSAHLPFWGSVAWLVGACTLFAFFIQNYAVRRSSPTRVALLMGSEPAFGALFACVWLGERLSVAAWTGGALIVAASLFAVVPWRRAGAKAVSEALNA